MLCNAGEDSHVNNPKEDSERLHVTPALHVTKYNGSNIKVIASLQYYEITLDESNYEHLYC